MDLRLVRENFPITRSSVYLDNASLAPVPSHVAAAVAAQLQEHSSLGVAGFSRWLATVEMAREKVARLIGATPKEIAFTQNTSEGINIVASMVDWCRGDNVIVNDLEYFPNVYPWLNLCRYGVETRIVRHRAGLIEVSDLMSVVDTRTRLIALSHVAWINGLRHDLNAIGAMCRSRKIWLCVDATQSVGALPVDVVTDQVDFLSCGGHKWLMAPLGTGFFYCRENLIETFKPPFVGWQSDDRSFDSQNYEFRSEFRPGNTARRFNHGNSNISGLHGFYASLNYQESLGWHNIFKRNRLLADLLIEGLLKLDVNFLTPLADRARSNIVNFIPNDLGKAMQSLKDAGIVVSIRAGGIRVSPAFYNTEDEIEQLVDVVRRCNVRS
jgi:selenocysteine lyase/cysteine desulfurase